MGLQPMKNVCMLHVACCSNLTIFLGKIKIGWKSPCLESSNRYTLFIYLFIYLFIFWKLHSALLTFRFSYKTHYKRENWYHCQFHFPSSQATFKKKVASTEKKEGRFFSFSRKRGVHCQIKGAPFFHDTLMLMHEMCRIGHGSTNRSKHEKCWKVLKSVV